MSIFTFIYMILMRGFRKGSLVDNHTSDMEGAKGFLNELNGIVCVKNFGANNSVE